MVRTIMEIDDIRLNEEQIDIIVDALETKKMNAYRKHASKDLIARYNNIIEYLKDKVYEEGTRYASDAEMWESAL